MDEAIEALTNPDIFFRNDPHTSYAARTSPNTYNIVLVMKKLGVTRKIPLNISVKRIMDQIIYESTKDSKVSMKFVFHIKIISEGVTSISLDAKIDPGFLTNVLGKEEFMGFVEGLINNGISAYISKRSGSDAETQSREVENIQRICPTCAFFVPKSLFCYSLFTHIKDMEKPACGGEKYSPYDPD
ncbi:MAG: hypothetical protein M1496_01845 [Candidatus Thermoplasmatota archaeon]|jgi:hypothetical protein|nr:hypothetical protein [Candidatus Thermoplasmatota archaeon]